ncbi:MAG: hypothetical protein CBC49_001000 [Alphaproteobacteria bacterium TMED89]|nr:hypothetical protein [Rhodospirillaceae bacterium]RPH19745.1 MAG: hypothetical protein CBC49_001000 [Alphaproteobacteria bacterium TMED89]
MTLRSSLRLTVRWLILISCGVLVCLAIFVASARADSPILEPISDDEFHRIFGWSTDETLLASQVGPAAAARARRNLRDLFTDKSVAVLPEKRPNPPLEGRDVLPDSFARVVKPALPAPHLILAGYAGQPEMSDLGCAVREHDQHNLAFRCNAPIALNVPGGGSPSKTFLKEMEAETGFDVGDHIWPGDKDALTGDRLLSARDIVTGMRFTLRYLDQRGFTIAKASCAKLSKWRWSYVCLDDSKWAALSAREKCEYVVENMLSVEGGTTKKWSFAPMPSPDSAQGSLISYGLTVNPRNINDAASLCAEVRAQEKVDDMVAKLLSGAPDKLGLTARSVSEAKGAALTLAAQIKHKELIVARLNVNTTVDLADHLRVLEKQWQQLGGSQVCIETDCARVITMALPPLPDYRPTEYPKR